MIILKNFLCFIFAEGEILLDFDTQLKLNLYIKFKYIFHSISLIYLGKDYEKEITPFVLLS